MTEEVKENKELKDVDVLIPEVQKIKDIHGNPLALKPFTLRVEMQMLRLMMKKLSGMDIMGKKGKEITDVLQGWFLSEQGEETVLDALVILTGKDANWICENLDIVAATEVLLHFFVPRIEKLSTKMQTLMPMLQKVG